ncbi:hypothetical protein [Asticcacaulis sp. W401b]|uniref:hypothetical protein n=1 Tax=Asticcacaulis sp. W401b TaxID=3388666 RepID=UPI00397091D2
MAGTVLAASPALGQTKAEDNFNLHLWRAEETDHRWGQFPGEWSAPLMEVTRDFEGRGYKLSCFDVTITGNITTKIQGQLESGLMVVDITLKKENLATNNAEMASKIRNDCGPSRTYIVDSKSRIKQSFNQK